MIKILAATYSHYSEADMKLNLLRRRSVRHTNRGSYAIEFAMTLPVLLIILSGTIDYGWYFHVQMSMVNATREAAHAGSQIDPAGVEDQGVLLTPAASALKVAADVWTAADLPGTPTFTAVINGVAPDKDMVVSSSLAIAPLVGFTTGGAGTPTNISYTATWHMDDQSTAP